jgi:hypothetical protein
VVARRPTLRFIMETSKVSIVCISTFDLYSIIYIDRTVTDHILSFYQSLSHLERMLSQSHPTYCFQLRLAQRKANARMDRTIVLLTSITVGVYCIQPSLGTVMKYYALKNFES